jgi:inorganic pyrophosphatase
MVPQHVLHPWHGVPFGESAPRVVNAIIEIPQGSRCKYEIDKPSGLLKLDRVIFSSFYYPINYGFIPQTYGGDKDPLDILVIITCAAAYLDGSESCGRNADDRWRRPG